MSKPWQRHKQRVVHEGLVSVELHDVTFGTGERGTIPQLRGPDWVVIVPMHDNGDVTLVIQHRYGLDQRTHELPAGMCDPGEEPAHSAARELYEETGLVSSRWHALGAYAHGPDMSASLGHYFLAADCQLDSQAQPDAECRPLRLSWDQAWAAVNDPPIASAVFGLLLARQAR